MAFNPCSKNTYALPMLIKTKLPTKWCWLPAETGLFLMIFNSTKYQEYFYEASIS